MECGGGWSTRSYAHTTLSAYGGTDCTAFDGAIDELPCNSNACPPVGTVTADLALAGTVEDLPSSFQSDFVVDMAALLSVDESQVAVESISGGSVVVSFSIIPDSNNVVLQPSVVTTKFAASGVLVGNVPSASAIAEVDVQPEPIDC